MSSRTDIDQTVTDPHAYFSLCFLYLEMTNKAYQKKLCVNSREPHPLNYVMKRNLMRYRGLTTGQPEEQQARLAVSLYANSNGLFLAVLSACLHISIS